MNNSESAASSAGLQVDLPARAAGYVWWGRFDAQWLRRLRRGLIVALLAQAGIALLMCAPLGTVANQLASSGHPLGPALLIGRIAVLLSSHVSLTLTAGLLSWRRVDPRYHEDYRAALRFARLASLGASLAVVDYAIGVATLLIIGRPELGQPTSSFSRSYRY